MLLKDILYTLIGSITTVAALSLITSCGIIKGSKNAVIDKTIKTSEAIYPQDNAIEEAIEQKIEDYTGIDMDLSPESKEIQENAVSYQHGRNPF